ncbi:MAG: RES domain-containing protein, partial [Actinomycetota bacterium]|nr:RES domain-containing protein [Actinomycetota bacterium]
APDPWQWTPWEYVRATGRWDDPTGTYRVLYTGGSIYACLVEVLAQFRRDPTLAALLAELDTADETDNGTAPAGTVSALWLAERAIGTARMTGRFVTIGHSHTLSWLQRRAPLLLVHHDVRDIDGALIRGAESRSFTQAVSGVFYGWNDDHGPLDGISFRSRWGDDLLLWAIYERSRPRQAAKTGPALEDPIHELIDVHSVDVLRALALHHLQLG